MATGTGGTNRTKETNSKYENSWVFGILKASSGEMDGNLTTSQYLETLDRYLNGALKCIVENTRYLDVVVTGLIGWQEENYRRRVSLLSKRQFIEAAITWILKPRAEKVKTIGTLRLDRGVALLARTTKLFLSYALSRARSTCVLCLRLKNAY
jgi:hypothetical protein